jgi:DNA (cytosine-5)-methyltransferase 1
MEKTICELFAGVGGFRLGFERLNDDWRTVWFSQWEPNQKAQWAYHCYISHWPNPLDAANNIDINLVDKKKIPKHSLLVGGFPCQDYSVARPLNGAKGLEGKKGVLWWSIYDVLKVKKPPFVLLENVDRLLKSPAKQRGRDFGVILACFAEQGYDVEWRVINAADYGGAQKRRRVFIFGYRKTTKYKKGIKKLSSEDIIEKQGLFAKALPIEEKTKIKETIITNQDIPDISNNFKFKFFNSGYMKDGFISTCDIVPKKENPIPLSAIIQSDVEEEFFLGDNLSKWEFLKGKKSMVRVNRAGFEYKYAEGSIPFPDPIDRPARTMLTSESSLNRSTHTILDPQVNRIRLLTPVEAERIQGFDDDWTKTMPKKARYFCMGNALVVPMITRIGKVLGEIIDNE